MKNPKVIIIFAATGFVLSLLTGIIFRVSFGVVILRALIFTVLFGGLGFLSNFIFHKYLLDSVDIEGVGDASSGNKTGSVVDIYIGDEPLVEDGNHLDFYVSNSADNKTETRNDPVVATAVSQEAGSNKEEVHSSEQSTAKPEANVSSVGDTDKSEDSQFKPISLGSQNQDNTVIPSSTSKDTGELPAIEDLVVGSDTDLEATDYALDMGVSPQVGNKAGGIAGDSETIAQAIRTVLAREG